jgi:outer membrane receptor for ferrienterochelin and colicins
MPTASSMVLVWTVVATTTTGRRLEDQPTRVEVIGREEIEEKLLMTPGDIVMMLNEMGGLRVQATSTSPAMTQAGMILCGKLCQGGQSVQGAGGQGRITLILSPPERATLLSSLPIPETSASRFEAIDVTSACLFRLTPDELVYALRSAISARWAGRNEHGTPVAWQLDRART